MNLSIEEAQEFFNTNIEELATADHNEIEHIEQAHCGDMLIENYKNDSERLKLWAKYDGESIYGVQVEYCGALNKYRYEIVLDF